MNKQTTEPTGEQFSASPELGFAFGRIPIEKIIVFLRDEEIRTEKDAVDIGLYLDMVRDYLKEGPELKLWDSYTNAKRQASEVRRDGWISKEVYQKYVEISEMLLADHNTSVAVEKETINTFLNLYPGLLSADIDGTQKLVAVDAIQKEPTSVGVRSSNSPVQAVAFWSDETQSEVIDADLYVDMTALPEHFSIALNRYRTDYDIDLYS